MNFANPLPNPPELPGMPAHYVQTHKIFMDTCTLLHPTAPKLLDRLEPMLIRFGNRLIVPNRCIEELNRFATGKFGKSKARKSLEELQCLRNHAVFALQRLQRMKQHGTLVIRGSERDNFADNVFLTVFTQFRRQYPLMLITQDRCLAEDISGLNRIRSVAGRPIVVRRLDGSGKLCRFYDGVPDVC